MKLLLASTSPARRSLLDAAGVPYEAVAPNVDEDVPPGTTVDEAVALLARRKAEAVWKTRPGALVLGADQLVEHEGRALGKPADEAAAFEQLRALAGRTHRILTGVCLRGPELDLLEVDVVALTMAALSEDALGRYVKTGEWRGCAGGYRVEARGQLLFEDIRGDRTSVQGLPMLRVVRMLRKAELPLL